MGKNRSRAAALMEDMKSNAPGKAKQTNEAALEKFLDGMDEKERGYMEVLAKRIPEGLDPLEYERELNWKRPTTYTVLRKLCEKGVFANRDGIVVSLVSRGEFYSAKSKRIIEESYRGSLPEFIAAFTDQNSLSAQDIDEIQELINKYKRDNNI